MRGLLVAAALLAPRPAGGESTFVHVKSPSEVRTDKGGSARLPPGYFLDEATWERLDAEVRRLQGVETRIVAENASLRASAREFSFKWYWVAGAFALGAAAGAYAALR